jgi:hypothetical protein
VERLAAKQEQDRQRSKSYRERKTASRDAPVENTGESRAPVTVTESVETIETLMPRPEDEAFIQDEYDEEGNYTGYTYTPMDERADAACRVRGFIFRAQRSVFAAEADSLENLAPTKEMREAADAVIEAWTKKRQQIISSMAVR